MASERNEKAGRQPQDPDTLVAQIEAAREDLARTLDEIADRVSPGKVAERGSVRVKAAAASIAKVTAEQAAVLRQVLVERSAVARGTVSEKATTVRQIVADHTPAGTPGTGTTATTTATGTTAPASVLDAGPPTRPALPPTTGVVVPVLAPRPTDGGSTRIGGGRGGPVLPKEALAAAAAVLLALWLASLARTRTRTRTRGGRHDGR